MGENIASKSADIGSDDDFEGQRICNLYLNSNSYSKMTGSQNSSFSETSFEIEERITKKVEQLTYLDLRESEEDGLKYLIDHSLQYNGTIYQCPAFAKLSLRDQVKLLCSYHSTLSRKISHQAKLQLECAPLPKSIKTMDENSILTNVEMDTADAEQRENNNIDSFDAPLNSSSEEYISKSGRVTKRKFYRETLELDRKKLKVLDGEWLKVKKTSPILKSVGRGKKLSLEADVKHLDNKVISKRNADIINRSTLFKEKDSLMNNRRAKIMEGVEQQKSKEKDEETKLEEFNRSLSNSGEVTEFIDDHENAPVRRRVKPPPVKPKTGRPKKKKEQYAELELTTQKTKLPPKIQIEKPINNKSHLQKKISDSLKDDLAASTSTSVQKSNENMVMCPICGRDFEDTKIEEHASSCGENTIETRSNTSFHSSMSCRFCDEVFIRDNSYEEHVSICPARPR